MASNSSQETRRPLHWQLWWAVAPLAVAALVGLAVAANQIAGASLRRQAQTSLAAARGAGAAAVSNVLQRLGTTLHRIGSEPRTAAAIAGLGDATRQADEDPRATPEAVGTARQALQGRLAPYAQAAPAGGRVDAAGLVAAPRGAAWLQAQYVEAHGPAPAPDAYGAAHTVWHAEFAGLAQAAEIDDLLLVRAADGRVVYSVAKRPDFQTDLVDGPFAHSHLGALFRRVGAATGGGVQFSDFAPYVAARGRPTAFAAVPVVAGGALVGVVVAVFDGDRITRAVTANGHFDDLGLGRSGDLYLVGRDDRLRSESRFLEQLAGLDPNVRERGSAIATYTAPVAGALGTRGGDSDSGGGAVTYLHPRSGAMLASVGAVDAAGLGWRVVAEIGEAEALQSGGALRWRLGLAAAGIGIAVLLGLAGVTLWTALPLQRLQRDLGRLRAGDPAARLPVIGTGEAAGLAQRVNGVLGRVHGDAASERRRRDGELRGLLTVIEALRRGDLTQRAYASGDLAGVATGVNALSDRLADLEASPPPVAPQRVAAAADALHAAAEHLRGEAAGQLDALSAAAATAQHVSTELNVLALNAALAETQHGGGAAALAAEAQQAAERAAAFAAPASAGDGGAPLAAALQRARRIGQAAQAVEREAAALRGEAAGGRGGRPPGGADPARLDGAGDALPPAGQGQG